MKPPRPPGPRDRLFGFRLTKEIAEDTLPFYQRAQQTHGDVLYMKFVHLHNYVFFHPDQVREVLVEKHKSFVRWERVTKTLAQLNGQSVLVVEGSEWQRQRRTLQPGFSPKRFEGYAQRITQAASLAMQRLQAEAGQPIEFDQAMNHLTMDVILRALFSSQAPADSRQVERAVAIGNKIAFREMLMPKLLPDWLPLPAKIEKRWSFKVLDDLVWQAIRQRRAAPGAHEDLLAMLLDVADEEGDGARLSDQEVRNQCMTLFFAGHETSAAGLGWLGWALAKHPEVAQRAQAEVDDVLQGREPTHADLPRLAYVAQVVKETLRLYSPATGVFTRRAVEDVVIGGWTVPRNSLVNVWSFVTQRDPRWFEDPERFDPDRFGPGRVEQIPRGAYFPFGMGPRVCIGNSFAMMEMTLITAMLLQRFNFRPAPGQTEPGLHQAVTVRPAGGVRLVLSPRQQRETGALPAPPETAPASAPGQATCPFAHAG
jgi:cytochrome P450